MVRNTCYVMILVLTVIIALLVLPVPDAWSQPSVLRDQHRLDVGTISAGQSSGTWKTYTTADGLADNDVRAIAIDGAGHMWFGTYGGGVSQFDGNTWKTYTTADGLTSNKVGAIAIDGAGHMWFGTLGGGVSEFDGSTWTSYTFAHGLADNWVSAIAIDGKGHLWFGTNGGGVSEFDGSTWKTYTTADGLAHNWVSAIAIDGAGHKWFGTMGGVSEFSGSAWTTHRANTEVYSVAIDKAGHKWFGTSYGVSEFDGSTWTTYTSGHGLASNLVKVVAIDGAGHKWFGTYNSGVSEFDGSTWTTYTTADGLANNYIQAIAIDGAGHKWFGTGGGVSEFVPPTLTFLPLILWDHRVYFEGPWEAEPNDTYDQANGPLISGRTYYGTFPSAADEKDYFKFDLLTAGSVELWLTSIAPGHDYDLTLRNSLMNVVQHSGELGNADEHILTGVLSPGWYWIHVSNASKSGSTDPYHLRVVYESTP